MLVYSLLPLLLLLFCWRCCFFFVGVVASFFLLLLLLWYNSTFKFMADVVVDENDPNLGISLTFSTSFGILSGNAQWGNVNPKLKQNIYCSCKDCFINCLL